MELDGGRAKKSSAREYDNNHVELVCRFPVDTQRKNNVIMTSKRRHEVVLTSKWRYYCVVWPLGYGFVKIYIDIQSWCQDDLERLLQLIFSTPSLQDRFDIVFSRILPLHIKTINCNSNGFSCMFSHSSPIPILFYQNNKLKVNEYLKSAEKALGLDISIKFLCQFLRYHLSNWS